MSLAGRRVLVTGADGFIGSHLAEALVAAGARVRAFVLYNALGSWGWLDSLARETRAEIEVVAGDIRDPSSVDAATAGACVVFHLAALVGIPYSLRSPDAYVETNVKGTLHVLQAARRHGVERLLVTSTSEVYGVARQVPMDEGHPLAACSPYSATKIAADQLAGSFARAFGLPVVIVRPFNAFGPRQSARAVIPTIITQLLDGATVLRLGNLAPRRDFNFVGDVVRAFTLLATAAGVDGETFHVASGADVSIGELAAMLIAELAPTATIACDAERVRPAAAEVERLLGSSAKLRALTGWRPTHSFAEGLAATIAWLREPANLARYRPEVYGV